MSEWSPFEKDVLLKGILLVRVTGRRDRRPRANQQVAISACGFI
jgi:hypothetical protein